MQQNYMESGVKNTDKITGKGKQVYCRKKCLQIAWRSSHLHNANKKETEEENIVMKYVIIGAGGTGGILGFYMTKAGKDVTLIARNAHLAAMKEQGLTVRHLWDGTTETVQVKAENMETYESMIASAGEAAKPDVILVCVKGYSLDNTVPFIQKIAKKSTIVIPILNIYGIGSRLQKKLPELLVTDGVISMSPRISKVRGPLSSMERSCGSYSAVRRKASSGRIKGDRKGLFRQRDLRRTF